MLKGEASRTQPGSDSSRAWEAPALRAPKAPDLGFGLSRASRFRAGSRIRVKACPGQGLRSFHSRLRQDGPPSRSSMWPPRVRAAAAGQRLQQGAEARGFWRVDRRGADFKDAHFEQKLKKGEART